MPRHLSAPAQLNRGLRVFFSEFVRVSLRRPGQALFFARTVVWQNAAARRRARMAREGLHVPPIAIFSITNRCNLQCKGCYAQAIRRDTQDDLSPDKLRGVVGEADETGVSFFVIVGGEPLTRPEILDVAAAHPHIVFLLVTNGTLLDTPLIARLRRMRNVVPALSIEGGEAETDDRRGRGMHTRLQSKMRELKEAGIFFSLSFTVTRATYPVVTDDAFVQDAVDQGCKLFFLLEYTPLSKETDEWVITEEQRIAMKDRVAAFRARHKAVFIAVPWDEEEQGGCLAAGRGFVHISASGDLEPCPFAPHSDTSLRDMSFREALRSPFLAAMRENHELFAETAGGCALWKNRETVERLLAKARQAAR